MGYIVQLENYQGPFDLLLDLIEKQEVDIWDIPIARITEQFLDYINQLQERDLVVSGDFLVMASTLLQIKTRMLLPSPPSDVEELDGDPREELVERLLEYKFFRDVAELLKDKRAEGRKVYPRIVPTTTKPPIYTRLVGVSLAELRDTYTSLLETVTDEAIEEPMVRTVSFVEYVHRIRQAVRQFARVPFSRLRVDHSRVELVALFLGVLELVRRREVCVTQHQNFQEIYVEALALYREGS